MTDLTLRAWAYLSRVVEPPCAELAELAERLKAAGEVTRDQEATTCCYAKSDKSWMHDPAGVRWETFYSFGEATTYGEDVAIPSNPVDACCGTAPKPAPEPACC